MMVVETKYWWWPRRKLAPRSNISIFPVPSSASVSNCIPLTTFDSTNISSEFLISCSHVKGWLVNLFIFPKLVWCQAVAIADPDSGQVPIRSINFNFRGVSILYFCFLYVFLYFLHNVFMYFFFLFLKDIFFWIFCCNLYFCL